MSNKFQKVKFVKLFASSEYKIRNKAYKTIKFLLKSEFGTEKKQLSENDIIAMWKGLYVWLYMQDKPIYHEEIVEKIANLFPTIVSETTALQFMKAFFLTMIREWCKIDIYRLDKYYMMVREVLNACLKWLEAKNWAHLTEWCAILKETVLTPSEAKGIGMKLHFVDIILDELVKAGVRSDAVTKLTIEMILSMSSVNQQHIYVSKMNKRVIDRLVSMERLQIDLNAVGETLWQAAANGNLPMKGKMRKLLYKLAQRLKSIKSNVENEEPMDTDEAVASEEPAVDTTVEMATADVPAEVLMTEPAAEPEEESTETPPQTEPTQPEEEPAKLPEIVSKKKSKKPVKTKPKNASSENDEKRVTFGKKYTKKFTKTTTSVNVSLGTVKQHQLKSILKRP